MRRTPVFGDPKTDFVFQRIFGSNDHKTALLGFLNDILQLDEAHRITSPGEAASPMTRSSLARITAFVAICSSACSSAPPPSPTPAGAGAASTNAGTTAASAATTAQSPSSSPSSESAPASSSASFLPLVAGSRFEYHATFRGREIPTVVLLRKVPGSKSLLYFIDEDDKGDENALISSSNIGEGVYTLREDGIYTGVATFLPDTKNVREDSMQLLLALPPKVHAKTDVLVDARQNWMRHVVVEGIEPVTVPAGIFQGCVHLSITSTANDGMSETAQAWLAPGVGLVRWERASGRVDALVSYVIPK